MTVVGVLSAIMLAVALPKLLSLIEAFMAMAGDPVDTVPEVEIDDCCDGDWPYDWVCIAGRAVVLGDDTGGEGEGEDRSTVVSSFLSVLLVRGGGGDGCSGVLEEGLGGGDGGLALEDERAGAGAASLTGGLP